MSSFDNKSRNFRHRNEIDVILRLKASDEEVPVTIFAGVGERTLDILNDERSFIPIRHPSGEIVLTAKTEIASIAERPKPKCKNKKPEQRSENHHQSAAQESVSKKPFDPYAMLRVDPTATAEEVRAAYKARIKMVHPDAIASLGLDEDITKAALLATQKVNYAYQKILQERGLATERAA